MSQSTTELSPLPPDEPAEPRPRAWLWLAGLLALIAALVCGYLAWAVLAFDGQVAGCGGSEGDCHSVFFSRWARWFNVPVALPAAGVYGLIFAALCQLAHSREARQRRRAWYLLIPLATIVLVAASWFSALQLLVIGKICLYCLAVHGCGFVLALLLLWHVPHAWRLLPSSAPAGQGLPPVATLLLVLAGFLGVTLLVGGQLASTSAAPEVQIVDASAAGQSAGGEKFPVDLSDYFPMPAGGVPAKTEHRQITLVAGGAQLDVERTPILGDPAAETVVVDLFDYTCPHCRKLNGFLNAARLRYGPEQLAVVPLVTPMNSACNPHVRPQASEPGACELARLAVALWQLKPAAFPDYHEWLLAGPEARTLEAARSRAIEILADDFADDAATMLDRAVADERVTRQLAAHNRIYILSGGGTIPRLLSEHRIMAGEPASADRLFDALEQKFGLRPPAK